MKTALLLLALASVAICAPAPDALGPARASAASSDQQQRRVARQAPGADILSGISEAFQQHVAQKQERVMDVMDTLGKALGSAGDAVQQAISDRLAVGADGGGQRSSLPATAASGGPGHQVGQVLANLGGKLLQAATDANGQRSSLPEASDQPGQVGQVLANLGGKLLQAATDASGQRSGSGDTAVREQLEDVGRKVGHMLVSALRKSVQQDDDEDDDDDARLVAAPTSGARELIREEEELDQAPCRNGTMMEAMMNSMSASRSRGRGRGRRASGASP